MDLAVAIPLSAATVNLGSAAIHFAVSRAPGWRLGRVSALIASSAGVYCLSAVPFGADGLSDAIYLATARVTYVAAATHAVAWLVFAFGGPGGSFRAMPAWVRWLAGVVVAVTAFFAATGLHLSDRVSTVDVAWAGIRYHYPLATPVGDLYGLAIPALLGLVLVRLVGRMRAGDPSLRPHLAGFAVFVACAVDEVLVANRVIVAPSLGAVGLVAVTLPLTIMLIERVTDDARRLAALSGTLQIEVRQRTEERDRARSALVEAERLAALGRLAASVGHEVNNPLTYVLIALEDAEGLTAGARQEAALRAALATAQEGASRIEKVVEALRFSSRRQTLLPVDLRDVAEAALRLAGPRLRDVAAIATELAPVPPLLGDEPRLVQALVNLLTNAAQILEGRHEPRIVVATRTAPDGTAVLEVRDNGPGIPAELVLQVTAPYFTTRAKAGGLGLGLFVARGILDAHGGRLELDTAPGGGTVARLCLPQRAPT